MRLCTSQFQYHSCPRAPFWSNSPVCWPFRWSNAQPMRWLVTAVASMRRTEALASVKFYQILSIFIFFIRLIILEDFIRLISYNGPCVRLGCSFFLATALLVLQKASNPPAMIQKFSPASNRSFKCKYPTKHNRNILRAVVCKYREFAVKTEISKYFIFSQEKPFGETFSKITIN